MPVLLTAIVVGILTYAAWQDRQAIGAFLEDEWAAFLRELG